MDLGLNGKTALVTASSRGLGRACAAELAHEGADVAICARGETELREAAERLEEEGDGEVLAVPCDVTDPDDIARLISRTEEELGPIDILVANAGGPPNGDLREFTDDDWQGAFELNLLSAVRLARAVLPGMRDRDWGRVVFVTSLSVREPLPGLVLSNAMRLGVTGLAKTLSNEFAADGVTVNTALPGYTLTDRMRELFAADAEERGITLEDRLREVAESIPAGRLAEPEEFSALVAFLCSGRASYVTGTAVQVDGGFVGSPL